MVMKTLFYSVIIAAIIAGCTTSRNTGAKNDTSDVVNDTVRIANDELQYEIIIIDPGFNTWLLTRARPRNFHSQNYFQMRNSSWVREWNNRTYLSDRYNRDLFSMQINYDSATDYGYEVNYLLYNYLTYFQLKNNVQLGGFVPQI